LEIIEKMHGFLLFCFNTEEDCYKVLEKGPWLIEGRKSDDFSKVAKEDGCAQRPLGDGSCLG
jgi:hypothetical protein